MNEISKLLTRQATRTVARKAIRKSASTLNIPPIVKHIGIAAIMAAVSYTITNKMK